jgi:hypothetical protein
VPPAPAPQPPAAAAPAGIHLERLKTAEELFTLAGQKAVALRYSGGDVDFWVEIEAPGPQEKIRANLLSRPRPGPGQTVAGYLLWVREETAERGVERWRVVQQRELSAGQTTGGQVATPLGTARLAQTHEDRQSTSDAISTSIPLWTHQGVCVEVSHLALDSIPSPLPPDRAVCLVEVREERRYETPYAARVGSVLGLLAAAPDSPLFAPSAVTVMETRVGTDTQTILFKVMCKVATTPAK